MQRFGGRYEPNRYLRFFCDTLVADPAAFPLHVSLALDDAEAALALRLSVYERTGAEPAAAAGQPASAAEPLGEPSAASG